MGNRYGHWHIVSEAHSWVVVCFVGVAAAADVAASKFVAGAAEMIFALVIKDPDEDLSDSERDLVIQSSAVEVNMDLLALVGFVEE